MKKIVLTAALLTASALAGSPVFANGSSYYDSPLCDTLCDPGRIDIKQSLHGLQEAINQIVDIDDANAVVQKAVNAGNLVDLTGLSGATDELGTILQYAYVNQNAKNLIDGGVKSDLTNLSQAATNVVNSITGGIAWNISQDVRNNQYAGNTIYGGIGGYDADLTKPLAEALTQTAVNASNLVDINTLKNDINQTSNSTQDAVNVASFDSKYWHHHLVKPDTVWDLGQSATNVTNSITLDKVVLGSFYHGGCACDFEITQGASADQFASNLIRTMGDVNNIVQSATNVANSVSRPSTP